MAKILPGPGGSATPAAVAAAFPGMSAEEIAVVVGALNIPTTDSLELRRFMVVANQSANVLLGMSAWGNPLFFFLGAGMDPIFYPSEADGVTAKLPAGVDINLTVGGSGHYGNASNGLLPLPGKGCLNYAGFYGASQVKVNAVIDEFYANKDLYGETKPTVDLSGPNMAAPSETQLGKVATLLSEGWSFMVAITGPGGPRDSGYVKVWSNRDTVYLTGWEGLSHRWVIADGSVSELVLYPYGWETGYFFTLSELPVWPETDQGGLISKDSNGGVWVQGTEISAPSLPTFVSVPDDGSSSGAADNGFIYCRYDAELNQPGVNTDPQYDVLARSNDNGVTWVVDYIWPLSMSNPVQWEDTAQLSTATDYTTFNSIVYVKGHPAQ